MLHRLAEDRQVHEAEEVHLEQADLRDLLHRELRHRDGALFAVRRLAGAGAAARSLQRHVLDQRLAGDDDAGGVGAGVPGDALQLLRRVDEAPHLVVEVVGAAHLGALRQGALDRHVQGVGHEPGDAVDLGVGHAEGAPDVADGRLRAHRAEGDDLRDVVVAVLLGDVADHLVAAVVGEVHVDVGHLASLDVEEALEDEAVGQRVDVGDAEAVEDDAGGGAAAHAHGDAAAAGEEGEVADDEHVVGEAGLATTASS